MTPETKLRLRDADPQVRLQALDEPTLGGAEHENDILTTDVLTAIMQATKDSDVRVRRLAANGLLTAAYLEGRMILPAKSDPKIVDLQAYDGVKHALLKAADDQDALVRQFALGANALTYKLTPELKAKILAEIDGPAIPERDLRPGLLELLLVELESSPKARQYTVQKLDDPKLDIVAATNLGRMKSPPIDALPKLLAKLQQAKDDGAKQAFVRAIGAYGTKAAQYLSTLEKMQKAESFESTRDNYRRAIENIRHPSPNYNATSPTPETPQ